MLRKVAVAAASNPHVEIRQDGEQFYIKTSTSVRTTEIKFRVGQEFDEETVDGRKCKVARQSAYRQIESGQIISILDLNSISDVTVKTVKCTKDKTLLSIYTFNISN